MDHGDRVQLAVLLGLAAAAGPVLATLLSFGLWPFRRFRGQGLRDGDSAAGHSAAGHSATRPWGRRLLIVVLGVLVPLLYAVTLVVDYRLTTASGVYVIDPAGGFTVWALAVTGPWLAAGFLAGGRHARAQDAGTALSARSRRQLVLGAVMASWSIYGLSTLVSAFGLGLGMSDSDGDVVTAAIHRAYGSAALGCAVTCAVVALATWRGGRSVATTAAMAAMPAAFLATGSIAALLV